MTLSVEKIFHAIRALPHHVTFAAALGLLTGAPWIQAEDVDQKALAASTVHWAYASYFGTGTYRMNDAQSVFVINAAPQLREEYVSWPELSERHSRYAVRVPITTGLASIDLEDVPGLLDPNNLSLVGVGLGAEIDIPVSDRWSVRPNVQVMHGRVMGTPETAWTYRADVRARYRFALGSVKTDVIAATGLVGYEANRGDGDNFIFTEVGAEFSIPTGWGKRNNDPTLLIPSVKYTQLPVEMQVATRDSGGTESTANIIDFGLAFARARRPLRWWLFEVDRVGVAVSASTSSDLVGIKLVLESMYEP